MKNGVGKKTNILALCAAVFVTLVLVTSFSNANLVIDDMVITLSATDWYNGANQSFQMESAGTGFPAYAISGLISTTASGTYDYAFEGEITITPAYLLEDQTAQNGGWAKGKFAGGSILTITGDLWNEITYEDVIIDGTILVAQMLSEPWYLEEISPWPNRVRGSATFNTTGGGLYGGDNPEELTLDGFRADFTFPSATPTVTNFGSTSYSSAPSATIQTVYIPEPASMSLFCLAAMAFIHKRKI
jgi:hypothetical protein